MPNDRTTRLAVCRVEYELAGTMKDQQVAMRHDCGAAADQPPEDPWQEGKRIIELHEGEGVKIRRVALAGSVIVERITVVQIPGLDS